MEDQYKTRQTLLLRAQDPDDPTAWEDFVVYYQRFIYHILHKMSIHENDFEDLNQLILIKLWKGLKSYSSDKGKFRLWLGKVTRNTVLNFLRDRNAQKNSPFEGQIEDGQKILDEVLATSNSEFEQMIEDEWRAYMCDQALSALEQLFTGNAVMAFKMKQEGIEVADIAEELGLTTPSTHVLISRVKSKFTAELKKLIQEFEF